MLNIEKDSFQEQCNACLSYIDVKCVKVGNHHSQMSYLALCKACRSLLHKRLHEEEEKENVESRMG